MKNRKLIIMVICGFIIFISSMALCFTFGVKVGIGENTKIVHVNFENDVSITEKEIDWKYKFLPCDMSLYITELSEELNIDSDLAVSILMRENPELNINAIHKNENGTLDLGLYQLNNKYIYTVFVPAYWDFQDVEFDPFNWKMNIYLALRHIEYLETSLKVQDDVICGYNAGAGAVINNTIPDSTMAYLKAVNNYYEMLKEGK